jgi:hypothetical protein
LFYKILPIGSFAIIVDAPVLGNKEAETDYKNEFHLPTGLELPNIPSISQDIGINSKKISHN